MLSHPNDLLLRFKPVISKRVGMALGLWGEAGIGKTHAVQQLLKLIQCQSLSLHCTAPLNQLVKTLPRSNRLDSWAERILERLEAGEHIPVANAADAIGALLSKLAPVVLHLEDLHEANDERVQLIQRLAQIAQRSKGVALLVTSRGELPEPIETTRLEPLSAEASRTLLNQQAAAELPPEACEWIFARAAGNPLFTLEYFRHLTRMGNVWSDGQHWHWRAPQNQGMPMTVEALLEQQILGATTHPEVAQALQAKAILAMGTSWEIWKGVAELGDDQLEAAQHKLRQQGILQGNDFAHPLFREVVVGGLLPQQRQALARRALEVLDDPLLAASYIEDARLEAPQALAQLKQAAQSAEQSGNSLQAARLMAQAAKYADADERTSLALAAAEALSKFSLSEALAVLEPVVQANPSNLKIAALMARLYATQGHPDRAEAMLKPFAGSPTYWHQLMVLRAVAQDYAAVVELWKAHPEVQASADAEVLYQVGHSLNAVGDKQTAIQVVQSGLEREGLSLEERCKFLSTLGGSYYYLGDYPKADDLFAQANRIAQQAGLKQALANTAFNRAYTLGMLNQPEENRKSLLQAMKAFAELGIAQRFAHAKTNLALLEMGLENFEQAETMLQESRQTLLLLAPSETLIDCERHLCTLYLEWKPPHGKILALKHAHAALNLANALRSPRNIQASLMALALAETEQGNAQRGLELAREAHQRATELGQPWAIHATVLAQARALEKLGQAEEALEAFRQAQNGMEQLGLDMESQAIGLEVDRLTHNFQSAAERLAWFEKRGLVHQVNLTRRFFPQLEEKVGSREQGLRNEKSFSETRHPSPVTHHPFLAVLGPMQITNNDQIKPVRGQKRQELLALLLEARISGRSEVNRLELIEALYPGEDELKAITALKSAVHEVRNTFDASLIQTSAQGYALGAVQSDAELFLQTGDAGLWRGAYLEGLTPSESTVWDSLYLSLFNQAEKLLEADPKEAARLGRMLLEADPYEARYLSLCLQALRASNNYKSLTRLYLEARERFAEVGEQLPEQWAEFLSRLVAV